MALERRILPQNESEVRALSGEDGVSHILGKGIVFNQRSQKLGWFYEIIDPRALDSADTSNIISCFNHDMNYILGSLQNRTLSIDVTEGSLDYDIVAPDTNIVKEMVLSPIIRGDVKGSSFMFDVASKGDEWEEESPGIYLRYVRKIEKVYELGPVSMPAYLQTSTDTVKRSFDDFIAEIKQKESRRNRQYAQMQMMMLNR